MFELLESAKRGDADSVNAICNMAYAVVSGTVQCRHKLDRQGSLDRDDLIQDAMLTVARDLHNCQAKSEAQFAVWLRAVAKNKVIEVRRKANVPKRVPEGGVVTLACTPVSSCPDPSQVIIAREAMEGVESVIQSMRPRARKRVAKIVKLASEGYSHPEIASLTDSTSQAVYGVLKRFRSTLRLLDISLT